MSLSLIHLYLPPIYSSDPPHLPSFTPIYPNFPPIYSNGPLIYPNYPHLPPIYPSAPHLPLCTLANPIYPHLTPLTPFAEEERVSEYTACSQPCEGGTKSKTNGDQHTMLCNSFTCEHGQ